MTEELPPYDCRYIIKHEFYAAWKIDVTGSDLISRRTMVFSPISDSDVSFYFECWYIKTNNGQEEFKAILVKSKCFNIPDNLKLNVEIAVNLEPYFKGDNIYFRNDVIVKNMDNISFDKIILKGPEQVSNRGFNFGTTKTFRQQIDITDGTASTFGQLPQQILDRRTIEFKSRFVFYNHFDSYTKNCNEMRLLKNLKHFANDFSCLYQSKEMSDVEFKVGNESFPAHKAILSAHSPVFQKMLSQDFLESRTNTITISDLTVDIFQRFLQYLYSGEIEDKTWETVTHLYALADKYDVRTLKRECAEVISSLLTVDVACEALLIAFKYDDEDLKFHAKKFAFQHVLELLPRDEWKEMIQTNPTIGYEVMLNFATPELALKTVL